MIYFSAPLSFSSSFFESIPSFIDINASIKRVIRNISARSVVVMKTMNAL